jgi:ribosomal protein L16 Arg81 hydroxylase
MTVPRSNLADGPPSHGEKTISPSIEATPENTEFDALIAPLARASFIANFWHKSFLRLTGKASRFQSLLSWSDLNALLEQDCLKPPDIRLVQEGNTIDPSRYMHDLSRLEAGGLVACLAQGATLIVDHVNRMVPRVRQLAAACEEALKAPTNVNLYAGWRSQKGFDLHWDEHDTMILQLSGRKRWAVYHPTRTHPLKEDVAPAEEPNEDPVWEGILEDGDMIYMPRGWWHVAYALDEPSLHLTLGFKTLSGVDFLEWVVAALRQHPEVRANVPRLAGEGARQRYVGDLRRLLNEAMDAEDALARFLRNWDSRQYAQPRINLPSAPIAQNAPLTMETRIRLAGQQCLSLERDTGGTARFSAGGHQWTCDIELVPALEALSDWASLSVRDLCTKLPSTAASVKLKVFLTALAMTGVILKEASNA